MLKIPLKERLNEWLGRVDPESDYRDNNLLNPFDSFDHETHPTALDEYAASLRTDPSVKRRADELYRHSAFTDRFDENAPEGHFEVQTLKWHAGKRQQAGRDEPQEKQWWHDVNPLEFPLEIAARVEARNRILDALHQDGLIGRTQTHRAVITPMHADRLSAFLDLPRTMEEHDRFRSHDERSKTFRFNERLWKRYRAWNPKTKTWDIDSERLWKNETRKYFKESFGWKVHAMDADSQTHKAEVRLSIPLVRLKEKLTEASKRKVDETARYTPYGEKDNPYWTGRSAFYSGATARKLLKPGEKPRLKADVMYDLQQAMLGGMIRLDLSFFGKKKIATRIKTINGTPHVQMRIRYPGRPASRR